MGPRRHNSIRRERLRRRAGEDLRDGLGDLLAGWGATAYDNLPANGKLRYQPDLSSPLARRGAEDAVNMTFDQQAAQLKPTAPPRPGCVAWRFASPYVFVGGRAAATLQLAAGASAQWSYSADGTSWTEIGSARRPSLRPTRRLPE